MTEAHPSDSLPQSEPSTETVPPEPPKPEPWTAEKVSEWNAYYDLFVAALVLVLCFFASANKIAQSGVWNHLQTGREIANTKTPVATDHLSYTEEGRHWVHVSWLADLVHFEVFKLISDLAPVDPSPEVNSNAPEVLQAKRDQVIKAEQWGAAGLIALDALLRAFTVLVLLRIRHKGPGLWWVSICAALTLGVVIGPEGFIFGGVGSPAFVDALTWGQLLFAVELLWIFRAVEQNRPSALHGLIPLFLLWANVDESFLIGLLVLAIVVTCDALNKARRFKKDSVERKVTLKQGLITLAACSAICLANPSFHRVYGAAFSTIVPSLGWVSGPTILEQLSFFGHSWAGTERELKESRIVFLLVVVGSGLASFALNYRRFHLARFVSYVLISILWAVALRQQSFFAIVLAMVLALNGQEWYQSVFGTEGRLGKGWAFWSTGGRAITLGVLALAIFTKVTGWGIREGELQFGFEFDPDEFRFEAADTLREAPFSGNVMNTLLSQGDALLWRASPKRKVFIDSRRHLFSAQTLARFDDVRKAIRDDDARTWKKDLDESKISSVMIAPLNPRMEYTPTYMTLIASKNWIPFYDDGSVAIFGRSDAPAADLAYFQANRLDADNLVYKHPRLTLSSDKLPRPTNDLDKIYQTRSVARYQPHNDSAARWLLPATADPSVPYLADPAHCFMAIRELRLALAFKPDDTRAYRQLADAYRTLLLEESGLMAGLQPTAENMPSINKVPLEASLLSDRVRQLMTALNFAVLTTPPPQKTEDYAVLADLNFRLAQLYMSQGYLDLGRDRLDTVLKLYERVEDVPADYLTALTNQFTEMNNQFNEIQLRISNISVASQAGPLEKAAAARQVGAVGLAIQFLEEANQAGLPPLQVKPSLLDLYCLSGQPDKALELWQGGNTSDANLSDGIGTAAMRQGRVFLLLGNYTSVVSLWGREAIPQLKFQRALKAPQATRLMLEGDPAAATRTFLELPDEVNKQAVWEFELGMACLEAGEPVDVTAAHLANALNLVPSLPVRPVIAYYLQKLGKPVPVNPQDAKKPASPATGTINRLPDILTPK